MTDLPTVGRIVHYVSYGTPGGEYGQQCRAAVVADAPPGKPQADAALGLCVLNPKGIFFARDVAHNEDTKAGGTWHWPEKV